MDNKNLFDPEDLKDLFAQLDEIPDPEEAMTEEEIASQRRYEEIIKKHKKDNK